MYRFLKSLYIWLPGKKYLFYLIRIIYSPSEKVSGYLKFNGVFSIRLPYNKKVKIVNDHSTLPTLFFWRGLNGYEASSLKIWCALSRNSKVTLDVGANFGLFGLLSKATNPTSRVILFEPLGRNVQRIEKNFLANGFSGEINQVAVGDYGGTVTFYDMNSSENTIGSIDRTFVESHKHHSEIIPIQVPIISLDTYLGENQIDNINLIKIDVEGADFEVLSGVREYVSRCMPDILIEVTNEKSADKIAQLLSTFPFEYYCYVLNESHGLEILKTMTKIVSSRNYLLSLKSITDITILLRQK